MLRFLLRPRWIGLTVFAIATVTICTLLGLWQLDRLEGRRAFNDRYAAGLEAAPLPLESLLAEGGALAYRRAVATGRFDPTREVILYGRSLDGRSGNHVLTPLVLADGRAIIVDRGWVPFEMDDPPVAATPPTGTVEVTGPLFADQPGGAGDDSGPDDRVTVVRSVDIGAIGDDVPYDLVPWFLQMQTRLPDTGELPVPGSPPELSSGPHLGYAFQWFTFAMIAAIGYVILVVRQVREDRRATESVS